MHAVWWLQLLIYITDCPHKTLVYKALFFSWVERKVTIPILSKPKTVHWNMTTVIHIHWVKQRERDKTRQDKFFISEGSE